jgi:hypothetical protein
VYTITVTHIITQVYTTTITNLKTKAYTTTITTVKITLQRRISESGCFGNSKQFGVGSEAA